MRSPHEVRIQPYPTEEEIRQLVFVTRYQLARAEAYSTMAHRTSIRAAIEALTRLQACLVPDTDDR